MTDASDAGSPETPPTRRSTRSWLPIVGFGVVFLILGAIPLAIVVPRVVDTLSEPRSITNLDVLEPALITAADLRDGD